MPQSGVTGTPRPPHGARRIMKPLNDIARIVLGSEGDIIDRGDDGMAFRLGPLRVIVSIGGEWDHASVSLSDRCPTWSEMEHVRNVCFRDHEIAVQYGVPAGRHINHHPYCLHWWRPQLGHGYDLPPKEFV